MAKKKTSRAQRRIERNKRVNRQLDYITQKAMNPELARAEPKWIQETMQALSRRMASNKYKDLETVDSTIHKIGVGDTVWLKSGSPDLLVASVDGDVVTCTWSNDQGELQSSDFSLSTLTPIRPTVGEIAA